MLLIWDIFRSLMNWIVNEGSCRSVRGGFGSTITSGLGGEGGVELGPEVEEENRVGGKKQRVGADGALYVIMPS
jgi:hypothetical protein